MLPNFMKIELIVIRLIPSPNKARKGLIVFGNYKERNKRTNQPKNSLDHNTSFLVELITALKQTSRLQLQSTRSS